MIVPEVIDPAAALAGAAVLAVSIGWRHTVRWIGTNRAVARPGLVPVPGRGRPVPACVDRALVRAGVTTDHRLLLQAWGAAITVAVMAALVTRVGPVLLVTVLVVPPGAVIAARGRAQRQWTQQLPLVLDAVGAGLRGGASLRVAIAEAAGGIGGPLGAELGVVASRASAGLTLADVLSEWVDAADDPPTRLAGAALVVAAELGGPGAAAVDAAAASLRDRTAVDDEVAALSVQARLSALLLTAAPVAFAFLLTSLDPTSASFLLETPAGWLCIATGLTLDAAGAAWMARLVRSAR